MRRLLTAVCAAIGMALFTSSAVDAKFQDLDIEYRTHSVMLGIKYLF